MGDHGVAVMSQAREPGASSTTIQSDTAALHGLVAAMVEAVPEIHCLRDPTRGGLATTLNELAQQSQVGIVRSARRASRCADVCIRPASSSGSTPSTWPTRAS
jgi:hydrogenase maturation factor